MTSGSLPQLSVVIPVYNEAPTLEELVARTTRVLSQLGARYEIVLVDDGSTDGSPALLEAIARRDAHVNVIRLSRNFGQNAALNCGLFHATGDFVVTMDGDLQNPPEEIPKLLAAFSPDVDIVSGLRAQRHEQWWRYLGSRAIHWIARLLVGRDLQDYGGQFKAYRREVIDATRRVWAPGKPFFALAVWLGFRVREVPVQHHRRQHGGTRYGFLALTRLNLDIVTSFTTAPLLALGALPVVLLPVAFLLAVAAWWQASSSLWLAAWVAFATALLGAAMACVAAYVARLYRLAAGGQRDWVELPRRTTPPTFTSQHAQLPSSGNDDERTTST